MMGDFGGWGMGFGFVFMLLFWGLIILGIAALIRWLLTQSSPGRGARDKAPLEIVQERYARGRDRPGGIRAEKAGSGAARVRAPIYLDYSAAALIKAWRQLARQ